MEIENKKQGKSHNSKIGHPAWNKGTNKSGMKGKKHSKKTKKIMSEKAKGNTHGFKKGYTPWNKEKEGSIPWNKGLRCPQLSHQKNLGRHHTEETKRKLSIKRKGKKMEEFFGVEKTRLAKIKISLAGKGRKSKRIGKSYEEQYGINKSNRIKKIIKKYRAKQIMPVKDTTIEVKIQNLLKQLGIEFVTHKYIKDIKYGYQCDIFIPVQEGINQKTIIECDGDYWHGNLEIYPIKNLSKRILSNRCLDYERTAQLKEAGFRVIRLWGSNIKKMNTENFIEEVICKTTP